MELRLRQGRSTLRLRDEDGPGGVEVMQLHGRMEISHEGSVVHVRAHEADEEPLLLRFSSVSKAQAWSKLLGGARNDRPSPRSRIGS